MADRLDTGDHEEEEEEEENEDEFDLDDFSESDGEWWSNNYNFEAHENLRRGSSEKINLACYWSRSVNELVK